MTPLSDFGAKFIVRAQGIRALIGGNKSSYFDISIFVYK